MEKLRSYIAPTSRSGQEYARLSQSAADEEDIYFANHGQLQLKTPQRQQSTIRQSWLALWTIAAVLFGMFLGCILFRGKQYTFQSPLVNKCSCPIGPISLPSDQAFDHIPVRRVVWKEEKEFVDVDPVDGHNWGNFGGEKNETKWTAWDDIYDGSWVYIEPDETLGIGPSVPIQNFSTESGGSWKTSMHGYSPSINHQIHCLGWIKHWLMPSGTADINYVHAGHCVEYIRHAIMCAGDLALEPAEHPTRHHLESYSYDESVHMCRDWTALSATLRSKSLGFEVAEDRGLVPFDHANWKISNRPVTPFEAV